MRGSVYIIKPPPFWTKTVPLSLVQLKRYLDKCGLRSKIKDLNIELFRLSSVPLNEWLSLNDDFEENLLGRITQRFPGYLADLFQDLKDAEFIGFSLFKRNRAFAFSLADMIRDKYPDKKIIFGGPDVMFLERETSLNTRDYWVIGEGEIPLQKILCGEKEKIYRFQQIQDLDNLPFYDFDALPKGHYSSALPLLSSRGCPQRCSFCTERLLYKKFRYHSPLYIVDQISVLQKKYNSNTFVFCDSLLNYDKQWLEDFCLNVIDKKMNIKWEAQMRIDRDFPLGLARLMKKSGCFNLFIGLESGSDDILKRMNKGFTTDCALNFFNTLYAAGLHFEISLIFGYPSETDKDFNETMGFVKKNKRIIPKIAQANPFIDYLNCYKSVAFPTPEGVFRVERFLDLLDNNDIKYTKSFISNLAYH